MNGQLFLVGLLVVLAASYLGYAGWRGWQRSRRGCGGCCGHSPSSTGVQVFIPSMDLRLRPAEERPPSPPASS